MASREEDGVTKTNVTLAAIELKLQSMNWHVEGIYKQFQVFKTLSKMWPETRDVPDNKQHLSIL